MNVALSWWVPKTGGSHQAIRGNTKALEEAGHDVDLYILDEIQKLEARAGEYDFVLLPYPHYPGNWAAYEDTHVHLQLGGYPGEPNPQATIQAFQACDTASVLDPSMLEYYGQFLDIDPSRFSLVPNPPNRDLFERHSKDYAQGHALVAKIGSPQKDAEELSGVAKAARTERFVVHNAGGTLLQLPDNVTARPSVPLTAMPRQYKYAQMVVNPSTKDVLPNTAFEAFMSGRPYLCRPTAIGDIQSVPASDLDCDDWGCDVAWWLDEYGEVINEGDHLALRESDEGLGRLVLEYATNDYLWDKRVSAADEWLEAWGEWNWQSKGETITEIVEDT